MLVKLCILDGSRINPGELTRFHPFFNQLSFNSTKNILKFCKLTKLLSGTLLYNEGEISDSVYIVLTGILVLHNK
jgi:hypothetical protein